MANNKYYVVKKGRVKGIYLTWSDCKAMVEGYKNPVFKSFTDPYEAIDFLLGKKNIKDNESNIEINISESRIGSEVGKESESNTNVQNVTELYAYVDGSYDVNTKTYGYGGVILKDGKIKHEFFNKGLDQEAATMRNVAGEIEGAMYAMDYCYEHNFKSITIFYDYNGIEMWCSGKWKTNKKWTKAFKEHYDKMNELISIKFVKVKAHSGDTYNEIADRLAKKAVFGE